MHQDICHDNAFVHKLLMLSLSLQRVLVLWKKSGLFPITKSQWPRPVALTSHFMETLRKLILNQLQPMTRSHLDPLQFTYQCSLEAEDTIIYLLNRVYSYLDQPASTTVQVFLLHQVDPV
ncbi:unnamed protein product [Oreochromis niloticus]|nr:unnamed protein product [Mustela putorius furo]